MNKQDYGHITPELLEQVTAVLEEAANHKYSTSKVYGAHNQVFKLSEKPESCVSCLRKRAKALKKWYEEYLLFQTESSIKEVSAIKLTDKEGNTVDAVFVSEDGVKGTLNTPEGKFVKAGTYTTAEGTTYTVQPGGKATLKDDLL